MRVCLYNPFEFGQACLFELGNVRRLVLVHAYALILIIDTSHDVLSPSYNFTTVKGRVINQSLYHPSRTPTLLRLSTCPSNKPSVVLPMQLLTWVSWHVILGLPTTGHTCR